MPFQTFVSSFMLIILTELGDKTMFTAMCLSAQYRRPWSVLLATTSALALSSAIGVLIGFLLRNALSFDIIVYLSGGMFVLLGLNSLRLSLREDSTVSCNGSTLVSMFFLILLSELGDKSQLATLALAAGSALPVVVFIGALTAFILVDAIGVGLGGRIASKVPTKAVRATAGIVFFAFGLLILFQII